MKSPVAEEPVASFAGGPAVDKQKTRVLCWGLQVEGLCLQVHCFMVRIGKNLSGVMYGAITPTVLRSSSCANCAPFSFIKPPTRQTLLHSWKIIRSKCLCIN